VAQVTELLGVLPDPGGFFASGKHDAYAIAEVPDTVSATGAALMINASGAVQTRTTVLITPELEGLAVPTLTGRRYCGRAGTP
jgi:GYD domain